MAKKKKSKSSLKYLRPEQVEELRKLTNPELLERSHKAQKEVKAYEKLKKEDPTLIDLKSQIKKWKEESEEYQTEVVEKRKELNATAKEILEEIQDLLSDKKDVEGGHRDNINASKELSSMITKILGERGI